MHGLQRLYNLFPFTDCLIPLGDGGVLVSLYRSTVDLRFHQ